MAEKNDDTRKPSPNERRRDIAEDRDFEKANTVSRDRPVPPERPTPGSPKPED